MSAERLSFLGKFWETSSRVEPILTFPVVLMPTVAETRAECGGSYPVKGPVSVKFSVEVYWLNTLQTDPCTGTCVSISCQPEVDLPSTKVGLRMYVF